MKKTRSHIEKNWSVFMWIRFMLFRARCTMLLYTTHMHTHSIFICIAVYIRECMFIWEREWLLLRTTFWNFSVYWMYTKFAFFFLFLFSSHHQTWNDYQSNLSMPVKGNGIRTQVKREKNDLRRKNTTFIFFVLFLSRYIILNRYTLFVYPKTKRVNSSEKSYFITKCFFYCKTFFLLYWFNVFTLQNSQ